MVRGHLAKPSRGPPERLCAASTSVTVCMPSAWDLECLPEAGAHPCLSEKQQIAREERQADLGSLRWLYQQE